MSIIMPTAVTNAYITIAKAAKSNALVVPVNMMGYARVNASPSSVALRPKVVQNASGSIMKSRFLPSNRGRNRPSRRHTSAKQ